MAVRSSTSSGRMERFCSFGLRWVALKMEGYMDDAASIRAFGIDVAITALEREGKVKVLSTPRVTTQWSS